MKLIEISLYDLHKDPKSLYGYDRADTEVVDYFWDKYYKKPKELKKRESAIAKSAEYSYLYAYYILYERFPEGEKTVAKSAKYSYWYARDVIKSRWPAGEGAIAKDREWKDAYEQMFRVKI